MSNYNWSSYQSATGCTRYGPAGAQALLTYLEDMFPGQVSMGICNCRSVRGGSSYSHHAECRAYDEGFAVFVGQTIGIKTLELIGPHGAAIGCDHMIMNHQPGASGRGDPRIYSARSPQGRVYTGSHAHKNHDHIGLTRNSGLHLTYATLVSVLGPAIPEEGPAIPEEGDDEMSLLGYDIGKMGEPAVKGLRSGVLQAMLIDRGYDLGTWGPNKDGVDQSAGDDTRQAFHDWKISEGITSAFSAGEGKIGQYEYAAFHPEVKAVGGDHPDKDHSTLATKTELKTEQRRIDNHTADAKTSTPHS